MTKVPMDEITDIEDGIYFIVCHRKHHSGMFMSGSITIRLYKTVNGGAISVYTDIDLIHPRSWSLYLKRRIYRISEEEILEHFVLELI